LNRFLELDLNEMPFPQPENVIRAAEKSLGNLNRYADAESLQRLRLLLSEYAGVDYEQIIIGPGSDLLLREIVLCFAARRKVLMADPTFLPTALVARRFARKLVHIRLTPPLYCLALQALVEELDEPSLIIIDNPNNPTGKLLLDREAVENILDYADTLLVVDEAYCEFSGLTLAGMVSNHANLAVTRTLDKAFGLAGARIGYLIAGRGFLDAFPVSSSFLPKASLEAAIEALLRPGYMWRNVQSIVRERERLCEQLTALGATVFPSSANFLLVRSQITALAEELRDRGVLVKDISDQLGPGFIRVAVGMPQENDAFLEAYRSTKKRSFS